MEMARKKYAELKTAYKGVTLPAEFKDTAGVLVVVFVFAFAFVDLPSPHSFVYTRRSTRKMRARFH